ncbi:MAG: hypothetical protein HXX11_15700 [Desulfuromonadales bacterium]|nr:hypothetical protein [Desulfuromonadales bacterium]
MRKFIVVLSMMAVVACGGNAWAAISYSGSVSGTTVGDGSIIASGMLNTAALSWNVAQNADSTWSYEYHWTTGQAQAKNVSFLDLSITNPNSITGFKLLDAGKNTINTGYTSSTLLNSTQAVPNAWTDATHTNSIGNFSQIFTGIKLDFTASTPTFKDFYISYNSVFAPLWGNFYADAGSTNNFGEAIGYNSQLRTSSTPTGVDNGNNGGYILTAGNVISPTPTPIPPAILLFGSGLLGLVGIKRRKIVA